MSSQDDRDRLHRFEAAEFEARIERARAAMASEGLDALLLTSEANFRYFTGFDSQTWVSPTRPRYFVLSRSSAIAVVPTSNIAGMRATSWISDVRSWQAPHPADEGLSVLAAALGEVAGRDGIIGAEIGPESRLGMPVADFLRLQQMLGPTVFRDGGGVVRAVRTIKSPAEIARIRRAAQILSEAFAALPGSIHSGLSEREVCAALHVDLIRRGADKVPYLVGVSGRHGYDNTNMGPTDRILAPGDIIYVDAGCTVDGYFCDFNRHFAFGPPCQETAAAFDAAYGATDAAIRTIGPGCRSCDVWLAMNANLPVEARASNFGRMGHGLGLLLTEPPSISRHDQTVLEPNMILTVEPGLSYALADGTTRLMVHEENLRVTDDGCELLSWRAPTTMPIV